MPHALSHTAREVAEALSHRGASFLNDLVTATGRLTCEVEDALWELATAGIVPADGFENLRALVDSKRRRAGAYARFKGPRHVGGRWALLHPRSPGAAAMAIEAKTEAFARQLLSRWGVLFRDLLARETLAPAWRNLLIALRRMEARGEIR